MSFKGGMAGHGAPNGGATSMPPGAGYPPGPFPPPFSGVPPGQRRPRVLVGAGVVLAILLATAALVVAVVSLSRQPSSPQTAAPPPTTTQSASANTEAADRALCQAIAPLMKESTDRKNAFVALGHTGTPERDAGTPEFVRATQDWATRIQPVLAEHADPPRYLTRTLQRYIDDMRLFVASVRPGPGTKYDDAAWTDSIG